MNLKRLLRLSKRYFKVRRIYKYIRKDRIMVNIGCGGTFHGDWVNFDFEPTSDAVYFLDVKKGLPFPDGSVDVVYHSHLIEHLTHDSALEFLAENYRILKPGGIIRVVVPNLEATIRAYIDVVNKLDEGCDGMDSRHEWMIIELLDQLVRTYPGGKMAEYFAQMDLHQKEFVSSRIGNVSSYKSIVKQPNKRRNIYVRFRECLFRESGEIHYWMYDRFSISRSLKSLGFMDVKVMSAIESSIPNFTTYELDAFASGKAIKPDSLFVEALKPA